MKSGFQVGDTVRACAYLPYGTQDFISPGMIGTIREKDDNNNSYLIEFEGGLQARGNGDQLAAAKTASGGKEEPGK